MSTVEKGASSTATSLEVKWTPLITADETGNSQILSYNLWWDANSGTANINLFEDLTVNTVI